MLPFITSALVLLGLASGRPSVSWMAFTANAYPFFLEKTNRHPARSWIRNPKVQAEDCDSAYRMKPIVLENGAVMGDATHGSYLLFQHVDLKNVERLTYRLSSQRHAATIELRLDSPTGRVVSTLPYAKTGSWADFAELSAPVTASPGVYDLYFVVVKPEEPNTDLLRLDWIYFHRKTTGLPRLGG